VKAVVAAVHTAADLTRMGGLAREIAEPRGPVLAAAHGRFAATSARIARRTAGFAPAGA
jgi:phosphate transport system protein